MKIRLFCTRAAGYTERGLAWAFSTTRIARPPSIQVPGTGERSGQGILYHKDSKATLYTGTRYRGKVWPLYRYQVQRRGLASTQAPGARERYGLNTGTRSRGNVCTMHRNKVEGRGLASIQVPGAGGGLTSSQVSCTGESTAWLFFTGTE